MKKQKRLQNAEKRDTLRFKWIKLEKIITLTYKYTSLHTQTHNSSIWEAVDAAAIFFSSHLTISYNH